jgi:hypothetical protein
VELLFQTLSYPFVTDLKVNPTQLVDRFMGMYDLVPNKEETLAHDQTTVQ